MAGSGVQAGSFWHCKRRGILPHGRRGETMRQGPGTPANLSSIGDKMASKRVPSVSRETSEVGEGPHVREKPKESYE